MEKEKENKRSKMESEFDVKDIIVIDNGADTQLRLEYLERINQE